MADARILVVGDSNAIGQGLRPEVAWPMRLMRMLNEPVQVYGAPGAGLATPFPLGIGVNTYATPGPTPKNPAMIGDGPSGEKVVQGAARLRCAVLALGTNDLRRNVTVADIRSAVAAILSAVVAPWICVTPPGVANELEVSPAGLTIADIRAAIAAECMVHGARTLDGGSLLPADRSTQPDGMHLTSVAQARLAQAIARMLKSP